MVRANRQSITDRRDKGRRPAAEGAGPAAVGPRLERQGALLAQGFGAAPAQRRIWRRDDTDWSLVEIGTEGQHPFPQDPEPGQYFNDVTGHSGPTLNAVRAGLLDTMMVTGGLDDLNDTLEVTWDALAQRLASEAQAANQRKVSTSPLYLGDVRMRWDAKAGEHRFVTLPKPGIDASVVKDTANFALDLMEANGQLRHVEQQDWYTDGSFEVHIDLNFYFDRPMGAAGLGIHKDTGGDNLFVNLVFDNEHETPATEWTQDRDPFKGVKAETLKGLLPKDMIDQILLAKQALGTTALASGKDRIEGGTLPPKGFVSWVDELIWHSTPSLDHRPRYGPRAMVGALKQAWRSPRLQPLWEEAIFTLSEQADTYVKAFRDQVEGEGRVFDFATWEKEQARISGGKAEWLRVWREIRGFGWSSVKWSGRTGNELDRDERTGAQPSDIPTGVTGRTRSNSDAQTLAEVQEAAEKQSRRSFIRTWVRIVRAKGGKA